MVSFFHALLVTTRGMWHVARLLQAPLSAQLKIPADPSDPWYAASGSEIKQTNLLFVSFLLNDLGHMLLSPALNDTALVVHHLGFIGASFICASYRFLPLPFSWLICGEASTILLNVRWGLLASGRAETTAMRVVEPAFALLFALARVIGYGAGLAHLWFHREWVGEGVPSGVVRSLLLLLLAGYALNLSWMRKIVAMGSSRKRRA